jgi:hypothetical protein
MHFERLNTGFLRYSLSTLEKIVCAIPKQKQKAESIFDRFQEVSHVSDFAEKDATTREFPIVQLEKKSGYR